MCAFIEVEVIDLGQAGCDKVTDEQLVESSDKRLIDITGIRLRKSTRFSNRSEIITASGVTLHVIGSYEDIVSRIKFVAGVARVI